LTFVDSVFKRYVKVVPNIFAVHANSKSQLVRAAVGEISFANSFYKIKPPRKPERQLFCKFLRPS